jgi:DHA1 family multidrug resistance protein-like MFS transporter
MFVVIFISQFATRGVEPFMPLYVKELAGSNPALNTLTGTVIAVTGLAMIIAAAVLGRFAPFWGYKQCLLVCLMGTAMFCIPQALIGHVIPLIALRFCQGLFLGGLLPMANSLIGLLVPTEKRGSVYGLTSSAFFLGNFSGPLVAGLWTALFGLRSIFYAASLLLLLNLFWVWRKVQEPQKTIVKVP